MNWSIVLLNDVGVPIAVHGPFVTLKSAQVWRAREIHRDVDALIVHNIDPGKFS
jgi:hypothetical protein